MKVVWLKGDYTGRNKERQRQAKEANCGAVIEFHFNSAADPRASGAEVYHRDDGGKSKICRSDSYSLAGCLLQAIDAAGLPFRNPPMKNATGTRAAFINEYHCAAVLLEPLFVSNRGQATWLHSTSNVRELGECIADSLEAFCKRENVTTVGLSIGHKFKTSQPNDRGAACALGDTEAEHAERLAKVVAASLLTQEERG